MTRDTPKPHLISPEEYLVFEAEAPAATLSSFDLTLAMASIYNPS